MNIDIKVPHLPENTSNAFVAQLHVTEGQVVAFNQNLFDIETDKVVLEVVAPSAGVIETIQISENAPVSSEQIVMSLRETESTEHPPASDDINYVESAESAVIVDSEGLAPKHEASSAWLDSRNITCGLIGLVVGIAIGYILSFPAT
ncbi:biotin/lipoyl-containing protein [Alteromonas sp. AMM-1]|uniref:biotin/lipoyl-containing protein n=1 Tax=Alteromonas sp. AMM-1 TaxID=3394233 RepID=UPI0039A68F83